jgi:phosphatidylserine/phosphatidylglycerophosphate/cardiolipin synthase-like enzyme
MVPCPLVSDPRTDASLSPFREDPASHRQGSRGRRLGDALSGTGNEVVELLNGDEILPSMLEAIRGARRTITFETYIYWSGKIGDSFRLNDEANLNMLDSVFTARLVQTFVEDKTHSRRMTLADWRARPWTDKPLEHAAGLLRSEF